MAAAYAFHIRKNHPFVDGKKRAGIAAMIAFLADNGWCFDASAEEGEAAILKMVAGDFEKEAFTNWAKGFMHEKPKMELRDFFSHIEPLRFTERFRSLLPAETRTHDQEFIERAAVAAKFIPFLSDLGRQQREALQAGDTQGWEKVTMLAVGMITLYALAEDMGYEW